MVVVQNEQRRLAVNTRFLCAIARSLLEEHLDLDAFVLCVHLSGSAAIARLNSQFLGHEGPTDVITFDQQAGTVRKRSLFGEIFICPAVAILQAAEFRTTWQEEMARYLVHGVLHLLEFDDLEPSARGRMKKEENRLLRRLCAQFGVDELAQEKHPLPEPSRKTLRATRELWAGRTVRARATRSPGQ